METSETILEYKGNFFTFKKWKKLAKNTTQSPLLTVFKIRLDQVPISWLTLL